MNAHRLTTAAMLLLVGTCLATTGCEELSYGSPERMARGLVIILPGIEGESMANHEIRRGLARGGIDYALVIHNWGFPIPGIGLLVNQTDVEGNRRAADTLAQRIAVYQTDYPDRPVFLVGHSGGGGVAVFALEALSRTGGGKPVEAAFLLSASLSASYPLDGALRMTKRGIVNVSNRDDVVLLGSGTATFGNIDGGHGDSCGRTGFSRRYPNLYEMRITAEMFGTPADPHYLATNADLVARAAPMWVNAKTWPPPGSIVPQR